MSQKILVSAYDPNWAHQFLELKALIWPSIKEIAISVEHVGSTSVPGLAAKPMIDIDIVIEDMAVMRSVIQKLEALGYKHRGNLGIEGREAFKAIKPLYQHNLYVCPRDSISLRNHLCLRETLRADFELRDQYAALKYDLAKKFPDSIDEYVEGKTEFILKILKSHGFGPDKLESIRKANLAPSRK